MKKFLAFIIFFSAFISFSNADFMPVGNVGSQFSSNLVKEKLHQKYPETKNMYCHDYRASYSGVMVWCSGKQFRLTGTDLQNNTQTSCKNKGETISNNEVCCNGLNKIIPKTSYEVKKRINGTVIVKVDPSGGKICANVHDGICEINYENEFNSPNDCKYIQTTSTGVIIGSGAVIGTGSTSTGSTNTGSTSSGCITQGNEITSSGSCCNGLTKVFSANSFNNDGSLKSSKKYICIKKHDNICSNGENKFNSADDCANTTGSGSFHLISIQQGTGSLEDKMIIKYDYKDSNNNKLGIIFKYSENQNNWKIINDETGTIKIKINGNTEPTIKYGKNYHYKILSKTGIQLVAGIFNGPSIPCKKEGETIGAGVYPAGQTPRCCSGLTSKPKKEAYNSDGSLKTNYDNICIKINDNICSSFENKFNSPNDCNTSSNNCIAEGNEVTSGKNCCSGLTKVFSANSYNNDGSLKNSTKYICIKKGDNSCSSFENKFNSPDDCENTNPNNSEIIKLNNSLKELIKNTINKYINNLENSNLNITKQIERLNDISVKIVRLKELKPKFTEISNFIYTELQNHIILLKVKKELMGIKKILFAS